MKLYLHNNHASSNVICMLSLNAIVANAMKNCKLGDAGFDEYDIFSPQALRRKFALMILCLQYMMIIIIVIF